MKNKDLEKIDHAGNNGQRIKQAILAQITKDDLMKTRDLYKLEKEQTFKTYEAIVPHRDFIMIP